LPVFHHFTNDENNLAGGKAETATKRLQAIHHLKMKPFGPIPVAKSSSNSPDIEYLKAVPVDWKALLSPT
jgi:hypothetical protein